MFELIFNPFTPQEVFNFVFFVSSVTIGSIVLIRIFTPPFEDWQIKKMCVEC